MSDFEAALRWFAVLTAMTWACAPFVRWLAGGLSDRGAAIARPLAPLLAVYPVWLLSAGFGLPYATTGLWAALAAIAVVGWGVAVARGGVDRGWLGRLLAAELVWVALFVAAVWLRGFTPDLTGTEKPMDAAFLSSAARAAEMPPPDPWYAGQPINYYYLGYALFGAIARMAGVESTTAFNLAIPTLLASTALAAGGFAFDALRPWASRRQALAGGAAAALLLAIGGNLYAPLQLLRGGRATVDAGWWDTQVGIGWRSSRIVCDGPRADNACGFPSVETINEFPFFSFLLGDLHPHVMALPITIVALTLALRWLIAPPDADRRAMLAWAATTGLVVGSLYALNSWDYPTLLAATAGAIWLGRRGDPRRAVAAIAVVAAASIVGWLPFWARFAPPTGGQANVPDWIGAIPVLPRLVGTLGAHAGERTSLGEYLTIFGVPALVGLALLAVCWPRRGRSGEGPSLDLAWIAPVVAVAALGIGIDAPLLILAGWAAIGGLYVLSRTDAPSPVTIAVGLFTLGAALSAVVEVFYIRDVFDDRMNTLFKVYYQVWTLYMLAAAVSAVVVWRAIGRGAVVARAAYVAAAGVVVAAALVYPLLASWQWTDKFTDWRGVDGIAYAAERYPDERAGIQFLRDHAAPGDVLLEAAGCSYQPNGDLPFNRMSAYSGVPTVIGWANHENQWRGGQPELLAGIPTRQEDVARMYGQPEGPLMDEYGVTWLVLGRYERGDWQGLCPVAGPYPGIDAPGYPGPGWDLAFEQGDVAIYRRTPGASANG